ncbi:LOW QUALITY PROTEIN: SET domain binding factor [Choristoneura fumiferana]|uniref:LOW QUALITY PROTEIN: SET domain binding factor n=1 Tax=Choristoneura fumiferana TaxID=7141 RepID=UPI003D156738
MVLSATRMGTVDGEVGAAFYVSVLTDVDANRHYCACLCFNETVAITPTKPADEDEESLEPRPVANITHHSIMYAPKCLVIVSRQDYLDTFRNCLGIIYTVWVENLGVPLETLVGNLLGCVLVPGAGGPQVRFSIGAGDRQALQPPAAPPLPVTHTSVHMLLRLLGIHNSVTLWCAVMSEHKVLLVSLAAARLAAACRALAALMFPFRYAHVFIPLLPAGLAEVLATPTPFLIGVHSSLKEEVTELLDVIVADLDVGSLHIPAGVNIPRPDGKLLSSLQEALALVLQPELRSADSAFAPPPPAASPPHMLDKEIRAVFMRTLAKLLQGYRHCLTLVRIHPAPVLTFHKAGFLGARGLAQCPFAVRLLDSMFFNGVVAERGPPWRPTDIWDELVQNLPEQLRLESLNPDLELQHIQELAMQLHQNENPNPQVENHAYQQRILRPPEGAATRIHQPPLPTLDPVKVKQVIAEVTARNAHNPKLTAIRAPQPRIVPPAAPPPARPKWGTCSLLTPRDDWRVQMGHMLITNSARRLEVGITNRVQMGHMLITNSARRLEVGITNRVQMGHMLITNSARRLEVGMGITNRVQMGHMLITNSARRLEVGITNRVQMGHMLITNSARRLEVLRACIAAIFECRYADARKSFPAVLLALRACAARAALVRDLAARLPSNKHLLHHHQFELLVRLMNCALQSASALDEHSIAAAMLPLATAYCRKLCTGVIQYAYMCIQEHQVWTSQQFWEAAFYQDVQRDIKALYLPSPTHHQRAPSPRDDEEYLSLLKAQEPSALEIAAEQMRLWPTLPPEKQREIIASEESTLYSQAIHYANRMVYLLLPLEGAGRRADVRGDDADRASNSITNSVAESDSADAESGFEEADPGEAGNNVIKMVSRFVDKVCTEGGVTAEHVRCLHQMIPGIVHMHLEALDAVARESRRLPPVQKPRIVAPWLIPGEAVSAPALRCWLAADGRAAPLLPAEGALFLTNYRLVFRGTPTDPFACEQTVVRSFPVCALTREKAVRTAYLPHLEHSPQEGLQLRSATFQLIKVVLDEEVSSEQLDAFRKQLARLRHPQHPLHHFALAPRAAPPPPPHQPKHNTLKGFAKKTLLKTARRAGLKPKPSKRQKYVLPSASARSLTSPPLMASLSADTLSLEELELAGAESAEAAAPRTLERVRERAYARDWARLGLAAPPFRLAHANAVYTLCRSYPAVIPVPDSIGDESLRRVARCYRQARLPCITWRHPRTHALLARSAASHHKGVMGMLKGTSHQTQGNAPSGTETTSSLEQERYLATLVALTPASRGELEDSSLSLDSLLLSDEPPTHTPLLNKPPHTLGVSGRNSGGASASAGAGLGAARHFGRWGSLKGRQPSQLELYQRQRLSAHDQDSVSGDGAPSARRAALYVVTEKGLTPGGGAGVEPLPAEYPDARAAKHAFKKLLRAAAPSQPPAPSDPGFYRLVEESGWLCLLRQLFQLSGAVVDLLDLQGSSVLLSLEDGWDVTAQISSLAQICLEPYYRTLEGFRTLVEKEWLALGHKFQQRLNIGAAPQQGLTPTFLMFLDAVHQLQKQFPLAFEFNEYYVRFIAYHSTSCRFRTFLLDNEATRAELGLADERRPDIGNRLGVETGAGSEEELGGSFGARAAHGASLFDHVDKLHQKSPLFYNFFYTPDLDNPVLRPMSSVCNLEVWEYYTHEELAHGAPYDLEAAPADERSPRARRTLAAGWVLCWSRDQVGEDYTREELAHGAPYDLEAAPADERSPRARRTLAAGWVLCWSRDQVGEDYTREELAHGAPYDLEAAPADERSPRARRTLAAGWVLCWSRDQVGEDYTREELAHGAPYDLEAAPADERSPRARRTLAAGWVLCWSRESGEDYTREELAHGAPYDLEAAPADERSPRARRTLAAGWVLCWSRDQVGEDYTREELAHGAPYDLEAAPADERSPRARRTLAAGWVLCWSRDQVGEDYTQEELAHGAPYDLEAAPADERSPRARRTLAAGFDSIPSVLPSSFSALLERGRALELELGHLPQKWRVRWDQLDLPNTLELQRNGSLSSLVVRRAALAQHKRATRELVVRGLVAAAPAAAAAAPAHRWAPAAAAAPQRCDHCDHLLWGPVKTGVRCVDCGAHCHERCADALAASCTRYKAPPPPAPDQPGANGAGTLQSSSQQYYEQFSSNVAENSTHEGHLYKRGALLKGWKQRWFVLDSIKHQLRYYDAMEDSHCKGFIDLAEVITVMQAPPAPGPPKKCDDRSFFDLRTSRRTYNFCASDAAAAQEWIEKLQACLQ